MGILLDGCHLGEVSQACSTRRSLWDMLDRLLCFAWLGSALVFALEELLEVAREKDVPALTVVRVTWNPISVGMDDWTDACDSMY